MNDDQNRIHLKALVADANTPKVLRDQIDRHLTIYDRAVALYATTRAARDDANEHTRAYLRNEPQRLTEALAGKRPVTTDDIAVDMPGLTQAETLANTRVAMARKAARLAWRSATSQPFTAAIDEVLPWLTASRLSTPWTAAMPAHLVYAWEQSRGLYSWHLPMVAPRHRFPRLTIDRPTLAMKRTWQAIEDGHLDLIDDGLPRRYRITAYWPDLNEDHE